MENVNFNIYQDAIERVHRWWQVNNKTLPANVNVNGTKYSQSEYEDAIKRVQEWITVNKKNPLTVRFGTLNPAPIPTPELPVPTPTPIDDGVYVISRFIRNDKQDTNYWCGPFMSVQLIYELYGYETAQATLANLEWTNTSGTGHEGISHGIKQACNNIGHKVTVTWQNFSSTGWKAVGEMIEDPRVGLGIHCLYRNKWGHYMVPVWIDVNKRQMGLIDSLNDDRELIELSCDEVEEWIRNTPGDQPSLCLVWNND